MYVLKIDILTLFKLFLSLVQNGALAWIYS
jgi:hypothetical protein